MGVCQVMEGRHCFAAPDGRGEPADRCLYAQRVAARSRDGTREGLHYFPRLKQRRTQSGRLHLGRRTADDRHRPGLDGKPSMILLDEPSMGLAPQIVEEIFEIVRDLNRERGRQFPACGTEHQCRSALRRLWIHPGERPRSDGRRGGRPARERRREGVLSRPCPAAGARASAT